MTAIDDSRFRRQGRKINFSFDGEPVNAIEGQSIAAALSVAGKRVLRRDKEGQGRGLFCGMGVCFECMVSTDGGAGRRACLTAVTEGMDVRSLDYWVPTGAEGIVQPVQTPPDRAETADVLIIGAGPAGLTAAAKLAGHGLSIVVVDERSNLGGQYFKPLAASHSFAEDRPIDPQYAAGAALIKQVRATGAQILLGATVWGAERDGNDVPEIFVHAGGTTRCFAPRRVLIATGAYERPRVFPGWTLPGVMTTGAAQGLLRSYRVPAGTAMLIAGNGPLNFQVASELVESGARVVAVVEAANATFPRRPVAALSTLVRGPALTVQGLKYMRRLKAARVPIFYGHHILSAEGGDRLRTATIAPINGRGEINRDNARLFEADTLCLGYGFLPNIELPRLLGCGLRQPDVGPARPIRDADGRSTIAEIFIVGDGARFGGAQAAMIEGGIAAETILEDFGIASSRNPVSRRLLARHHRFQEALWSLFRAPSPDLTLATPETPVCRCENVTLGTLDRLISEGVTDLGNLKRLSRVGMGYCQGRYCTDLVATHLKRRTGNAPGFRMFAAQTPLKPIPIVSIMGEQAEWSGYRPAEVRLPEPIPAAHHAEAEKWRRESDVLVIGGGIAGVTTALFLARAGIESCLVEAGQINGQASGGNAGSLHLQLLSFDFSDADAVQSSPAMQTLRLQKQGIELWQRLERELDTDFHITMCGGLMVAETDRDMVFLKAKAAAENNMGIETEILDAGELRRLAPAVSHRMVGAAYCPGEGHINPMAATPVLARAAAEAGVNIASDTVVLSIERDGSWFRIGTNRGEIRCRRIVNAAGGWSRNIALLAGIDLPVQSAPQQMIVTEAAAPLLKHLIAHAHRHLTMKQADNGNLIIGGGWYADFDAMAGRPRTRRDSIAGNLWIAHRVVPSLAKLNVIRSWAAVGVMIDGAPILGETPGHPGFYTAVGANGYTMGPIMGQVTADLISRGDSEVDHRPFTLERF